MSFKEATKEIVTAAAGISGSGKRYSYDLVFYEDVKERKSITTRVPFPLASALCRRPYRIRFST